MKPITSRPKLVVWELDPYGVVLEIRCWSEEEARDLYERVELRGRGFSVSVVYSDGAFVCSKGGTL